MVSVVIRKSGPGTLRYFGDDFVSSMWVDDTGGKLLTPSFARLRPRQESVKWLPIAKKEFEQIVNEIEAIRKTRGILALELGFAGPKSLSAAALADKAIRPKMINIHCSAVDDTLAFASNLFVARAEGELIDCGVRLMEFPHPWNRVNDPQQHSHILILKDFDFSHALWTTPIFVLQRALREVYHYSLCSRLLAAGYGIVLGEPGSLAWELDGVPKEVIREFSRRSEAIKEMAIESPRGFFSLGAEFRVAGWASRRILPRTDPSKSLNDARKLWGSWDFSLESNASPLAVHTAEIDLAHVFRMSSVVTREQFVGSHLRWWLGSRKPLAEAIALAHQILNRHIERARILHSGFAYCRRDALDPEDKIVRAITSGFSDGASLKHRGKDSLPRLTQVLLETPHAVKVISTYGEVPPVANDLVDEHGKPFVGIIKKMKFWNTAEVLEAIHQRGAKDLIVFVEEPLWVGDFGARAAKILATGLCTTPVPDKPFTMKRRKIVVKKGDLSRPKQATEKLGFLRDEVEPSGVVLAPWLTAEEISTRNWKRLSELPKDEGQPVNLLRRVPWEQFTKDRWEGLGLFATRRAGADAQAGEQFIRRGQVWFFTGPVRNDEIELIGIKRLKKLGLQSLRDVAQSKNPHLALVERVEVTLAPGVPLLSPMRFESQRQVFRPGEIQILTGVEEDGRLRFGDRYWPCEPILLEPAYYVREFAKKQPPLPSITLQAGMNLVRILDELPRARMTVLSTHKPEEVCQNLARDLRHQGDAKKREATKRVLSGEWMDDLAPLFPKPEVWAGLIKDSVIGVGGDPAPEITKVPESPKADTLAKPPVPPAMVEDTPAVATSIEPSVTLATAPARKSKDELDQEPVRADASKPVQQATRVPPKKKKKPLPKPKSGQQPDDELGPK